MSDVTVADLRAADKLLEYPLDHVGAFDESNDEVRDRDFVRMSLAAALAAQRAPFLALADEFDAQVPWPHSWIGNRIREAAGVEK